MSLLSRIRLATSQALKGFSGFDLEAEIRNLKEQVQNLDGELAGMQVAFVEDEEKHIAEVGALRTELLQSKKLAVEESTNHLKTQLWAADMEQKLLMSENKVKMYKGQVETLTSDLEATRAALTVSNKEAAKHSPFEVKVG